MDNNDLSERFREFFGSLYYFKDKIRFQPESSNNINGNGNNKQGPKKYYWCRIRFHGTLFLPHDLVR